MPFGFSAGPTKPRYQREWSPLFLSGPGRDLSCGTWRFSVDGKQMITAPELLCPDCCGIQVDMGLMTNTKVNTTPSGPLVGVDFSGAFGGPDANIAAVFVVSEWELDAGMVASADEDVMPIAFDDIDATLEPADRQFKIPSTVSTTTGSAFGRPKNRFHRSRMLLLPTSMCVQKITATVPATNEWGKGQATLLGLQLRVVLRRTFTGAFHRLFATILLSAEATPPDANGSPDDATTALVRRIGTELPREVLAIIVGFIEPIWVDRSSSAIALVADDGFASLTKNPRFGPMLSHNADYFRALGSKTPFVNLAEYFALLDNENAKQFDPRTLLTEGHEMQTAADRWSPKVKALLKAVPQKLHQSSAFVVVKSPKALGNGHRLLQGQLPPECTKGCRILLTGAADGGSAPLFGSNAFASKIPAFEPISFESIGDVVLLILRVTEDRLASGFGGAISVDGSLRSPTIVKGGNVDKWKRENQHLTAASTLLVGGSCVAVVCPGSTSISSKEGLCIDVYGPKVVASLGLADEPFGEITRPVADLTAKYFFPASRFNLSAATLTYSPITVGGTEVPRPIEGNLGCCISSFGFERSVSCGMAAEMRDISIDATPLDSSPFELILFGTRLKEVAMVIITVDYVLPADCNPHLLTVDVAGGKASFLHRSLTPSGTKETCRQIACLDKPTAATELVLGVADRGAAPTGMFIGAAPTKSLHCRLDILRMRIVLLDQNGADMAIGGMMGTIFGD